MVRAHGLYRYIQSNANFFEKNSTWVEKRMKIRKDPKLIIDTSVVRIVLPSVQLSTLHEAKESELWFVVKKKAWHRAQDHSRIGYIWV